MPVRYVRSAAVAAAVVLAATGCGGVGGGSDDDGAAITLQTMGFGTGDEIAQVRVDEAQKAIAPAKVKIGESAFDAQQFLSAVASDSPPDLVYMDRQLIGTYAARGTLVPLTDCIADEKIDMSQYRTPAVDEVTLDGDVYGLPEFYNNRLLMINDSVVTGAGLSPADVDTTDWTKLDSVATALAQTDGTTVTRIGFDPKIPEFLPMWAKANGTSLISDDGKTANLDDPKLVAALDYAVSLIEKQGGWGAFKAFRDSWDFFGEKNEFAQGQVGAFPMEDWYLNVLADASPDLKLTVTPFKDTQGQPVDWVTGSAWGIPKGSPHQAEACTFIKTMSDSATWVKAAEARAAAREAEGKTFTGVYTGNQVADEKIFGELVKPSGNPVFDNAIQTVLQTQESAFSMPSSPAGAEFQKAWQDAVNRVLSGQQEPAAAMAQAQQEAQKALDEASGN